MVLGSKGFAAALTAMGLLALPAGAASVNLTVDSFGQGETAAARAAYDAYSAGAHMRKAEDFEGFSAWNGAQGTENAVQTGAGTIQGISAEPGSGYTAINGGHGLQVRDATLKGMEDFPSVWGRQNLDTGGKNWLDSNDLTQMVWKVGDVGKFDRLSFFLTDVGDIEGTNFTVQVAGNGIAKSIAHIAPQENGAINLVKILLDGFVDSATVTLTSNHNDGFGIDDLTVAKVSPVPLPMPGLLLLAGIGSFALIRGRRIAVQA